MCLKNFANYRRTFSLYLACKYRKCPNDVLGLKWAEALKAAALGLKKAPGSRVCRQLEIEK
jgi:hypothetical protein